MISALIGLIYTREKWLIFKVWTWSCIWLNDILIWIRIYQYFSPYLTSWILSKKLSQKTLLVLFNGGTTRLCTSMKFINKTFSLMQTTQYCFSCIWIEKANFKLLACRRGKQTIPIKKKNETMIEEELYLFTWMHFDLICFYCMTRALSPW